MLQYNPSISGSLSVTGSLIVTNGVIGTVSGVDVQIFSSSINQVITGIQAATGSQEGRLTSIESFTSSVSTTNTFTSSASARLNSIETISASNIARINSLETTSASVNTLNTTQNDRLNSLENKTGSLASTGSNTFIGTQVFTGSVYITQNLVVQGSSSLQNITASAVSIGTNTILLNTDNPAVRYAGISAIDSGSAAGKSGSLYFDSTDNEWIFVHAGNTAVTSSTVITGPETFDSIGSETRLTTNTIPKTKNGFHLYDSSITDDGSIVQIQSTTLAITGSRVGINTSFPTQALEVSGSILTNNTFRIVKSPSDTVQQGPSVYLVGGSGASYTQLQQGVDRFIIFGFNGSGWEERLTINNSTKNIGIGTNNPSASLHIGISGAAAQLWLQRTDGYTATKLIGGTLADGNGFKITMNATDALSITSAGNVGIKTLNPFSKLDVSTSTTEALCVGNSSDTITADDLIGALSFVSRDGSTYSSGGVANIRSYATQTYNTGNVAADLRFYVSNGLQNTTAAVIFGTEAMRITNDGKVGIGTTSPLKNLHVYADNGSGIGIGKNLTGSNVSSNLFFYPSSVLSEKRNWGITTYFTGAGLMEFRRSSTTTSDPYDNGVTVMTLDGVNDRVGIGITNPSYLLDVNGDAKSNRLYLSTNANNIFTKSNGSTYNRFLYAGSNLHVVFTGGTTANNGAFGVNNFEDTARIFNVENSGNTYVNGKFAVADGYSTYSRANINGSVKINRSIYNWYQGYWTGNSTYWHMKTNMYGGAAGNTMYTMSLFKGYLYSYGNAGMYEGTLGFHNWSGTIYQRATTGSLFSNVYNSSDGYIVLVVPSGDGEAGVTIDWHQAYAYPWVEAQVTAAGLYGSTSGKY